MERILIKTAANIMAALAFVCLWLMPQDTSAYFYTLLIASKVAAVLFWIAAMRLSDLAQTVHDDEGLLHREP